MNLSPIDAVKTRSFQYHRLHSFTRDSNDDFHWSKCECRAACLTRSTLVTNNSSSSTKLPLVVCIMHFIRNIKCIKWPKGGSTPPPHDDGNRPWLGRPSRPPLLTTVILDKRWYHCIKPVSSTTPHGPWYSHGKKHCDKLFSHGIFWRHARWRSGLLS